MGFSPMGGSSSYGMSNRDFDRTIGRDRHNDRSDRERAEREKTYERQERERKQREAYQAEARTIEAPPEEAPTFVDSTLSAIKTAMFGNSQEEAQAAIDRAKDRLYRNKYRGMNRDEVLAKALENSMNQQGANLMTSMAGKATGIPGVGGLLAKGVDTLTRSDVPDEFQTMADEIVSDHNIANISGAVGMVNPALGFIADGITSAINMSNVSDLIKYTSPEHYSDMMAAQQERLALAKAMQLNGSDHNQSQGLLAPSGPTLFYDNPVAFQQQQGNDNWSSDWLEQRRRLMGMS